MARFPQEYDENVRRRKQSKTSKTSQSTRRSDHKHEYEKVIIREFIGYAWGGRCSLCGRFQGSYGRFSTARYMDFRRPESFEKPGISNQDFLSLEEIRARYPGIPVYEFFYEDMRYHLMP
nr:hypothetical protein [uncultured Oscillibacter sp.]